MNKKIIIAIIIIIIGVILALGFVKKIREPKTGLEPGGEFTLGPGDYDFNLTHDGLKRFYIAHVPQSYDKNFKMPLVFAIHGGGGNAENSPHYFGLNGKSDKENFVVVYPEGSGKTVLGKTFATWNAGRCCSDALKNNIDDVGFINAVIEKLKSDFNIDEKRIYITGMSNGAQMAYRLACELSDKIAAIAPSGSQGTFDSCQPKRPVPVFHIQGKDDPCSVYEGGTCGRCMAEFWREIGVSVDYDDWSCIPIPDYINSWRIKNDCSDKTKITFQNKGAICITYESCQNNADVTLCTVDGLGHNWSGQTSFGIDACDRDPNGKICKIWKEKVGPLSQDLIANDKIWEFFKKHPMD